MWNTILLWCIFQFLYYVHNTVAIHHLGQQVLQNWPFFNGMWYDMTSINYSKFDTYKSGLFLKDSERCINCCLYLYKSLNNSIHTMETYIPFVEKWSAKNWQLDEESLENVACICIRWIVCECIQMLRNCNLRTPSEKQHFLNAENLASHVLS